MAVFGVILLVAGFGAVIYGVNQNNSIEAQLSSFFGSGSTNPGTTFIIVGAAGLVIGAILLIMQLAKGKHGR